MSSNTLGSQPSFHFLLPITQLKNLHAACIAMNGVQTSEHYKKQLLRKVIKSGFVLRGHFRPKSCAVSSGNVEKCKPEVVGLIPRAAKVLDQLLDPY